MPGPVQWAPAWSLCLGPGPAPVALPAEPGDPIKRRVGLRLLYSTPQSSSLTWAQPTLPVVLALHVPSSLLDPPDYPPLVTPFRPPSLLDHEPSSCSCLKAWPLPLPPARPSSLVCLASSLSPFLWVLPQHHLLWPGSPGQSGFTHLRSLSTCHTERPV